MAIFKISYLIGRALGITDIPSLVSSSESQSGKTVNATTSLQVSTVFACVRLVSQRLGTLACQIMDEDKNGDFIPTEDKELERILRYKPNASMSAVSFWTAVFANVLLWGNAYAVKRYRGSGSAKKLISLEMLLPEYTGMRFNVDGSVTYIYSGQGQGTIEYSEDEVVHFKGFSLSGRLGLSVISYACQTIGNALALDETMGRLYSNGMRPGGALTLPNFLKEEQRTQVRTNIASQIGGVAKSGGVIILEGGMKYEPLSMPPEDAQMVQSKNFSVEEICRWFGVPPVLLGHNSGTTTWGSGIEQINIGFSTYTLDPIIKGIESEIERSIIPSVNLGKTHAVFDMSPLDGADSKARSEKYASGSQNGWLTRSEIRRRERLPYKEGSDDLTVQSALTKLEDLGKNKTNSQNAASNLDKTSQLNAIEGATNDTGKQSSDVQA